jgi:hypothetical protein
VEFLHRHSTGAAVRLDYNPRRFSARRIRPLSCLSTPVCITVSLYFVLVLYNYTLYGCAPLLLHTFQCSTVGIVISNIVQTKAKVTSSRPKRLADVKSSGCRGLKEVSSCWSHSPPLRPFKSRITTKAKSEFKVCGSHPGPTRASPVCTCPD